MISASLREPVGTRGHNKAEEAPPGLSRVRAPLVALALLGLLVAGCVTPPQAAVKTASTGALPIAELQNLSPKVDAKATLALLKDFSQAYPYRQSDGPTHEQARDALEKIFKDAGLTTMRQAFPSGGPTPANTYQGANILGIKWGEDKTHWIVVGAHYDITEGAVFGTYDDGSGTILTAKLAQAFAKLNTTRTIAFIEFDQEERGLVGSRYFVKSVLDGSFAVPAGPSSARAEDNGDKPNAELGGVKAGDVSGVHVDGMIDLDMVGITWPHPAHLIVWQNSPSLQNETKQLATAVGVPADHLEFRKPNGGSSDGASFIAQNMSTAYFWSDWDEYVLPNGQVAPQTPVPYVGPYPWWHKLDTYDTMVASAGDETTLQKGFQTTLDIVSPLLAHMASPAFAPDSGDVPYVQS
jgi:Zn-dependent M28 family amino/carboxypeptidase